MDCKNVPLHGRSLFETFFSVIPDHFFLADLDYILREFRTNEGCHLFTETDDMIGKPINEVLIPELASLVKENMMLAKKTGTTSEFQFDIELKDKGTHRYDCRICITGDKKSYIGVVRDMTEQYKALEALKAGELRYRNLMEKAPFPLIISRISDGTLRYGNNRAKQQFGFGDGEGVGMKADLFYQDQLERVAFLNELKQNGFVTDREMKMINWKREPYWALISASLVEFENEPAVMVSINDITRRKLTDDALRASEEKYRLLTENTLDVIWVYNLTRSMFTYFSPSVQQLRGYSVEEALMLTLEETLTPESFSDLQNEISKTLRDFLANPESGVNFMLETKQYRKNGDTIWVEISARYCHNSYNEIEIIGVSRNIEKRKKAEDQVIYLSYHDQLTGLYNRRFYEEELKRLDTERNLPITLVMADVNGLKLVNDSFGHDLGDKLLKAFGEILSGVCRSDDIIARIGGDEFVILFPKLSSELAEKIINRIKTKIAEKKIDKVNISVSFGWKTKISADESIKETFKLAEDLMYRRKLIEGRTFKNEIIKLFTEDLYEHSEKEHVHSEHVSDICVKIGKAMEMASEDVARLKVLGMLHDIGKIGVNETLINAPGKFNDAEWMDMKRHPEVGYQILRSVNDYIDLSEHVLAHHERMDGTGYPKGISGKDIPLWARIIAIADAYDSMTRTNSYKQTLGVKEAIQEIKKNAGVQFDPRIAKIFVEKVLGQEW